MRIIYFDTNAILKFFIDEEGSDVVRAIVENRDPDNQYDPFETWISRETSQIAIYEFKKIIKEKRENGELSSHHERKILSRAKTYFGGVFRIIDHMPKPGIKFSKDTNYVELCNKHGKEINKFGRDARHLAIIINYLRGLKNPYRPWVLTADKVFSKIIKKEGFDVVNPERVTIKEFKALIET